MRQTDFYEMIRRAEGEGGGSGAPPADPPTQDPPADPPADSAAAAGDPPADPAAASARPASVPRVVPQDIFNRRIGQLSNERDSYKQEAEQAKAELERLRNPPRAGDPPIDPAAPPAPTNGRFYTDAELQRITAQRSTELAAQNEFNAKSQQIYSKGVAEFPDFAPTLTTLQNTVGGMIPQPMLEALLEQDNPHKVIYELGKNPEKAAEFFMLQGAKQAAAITKFAAQLGRAPAPRTSQAPAPIEPQVGARGAPPPGDVYNMDDKPMEDWLRAREAQLKRKKEARV